MPSTMTDPDSSSARATEGPASGPAASQQRRRKSAYGTASAPDARIRARAASICVARSTLRASSTVRLAAGGSASAAGSRLAGAGAGAEGAAGGTRPSRLIRGNARPTPPRSRIRSAPSGMKRSGGTAGRNAGCSCRKRRSPNVAGDDEEEDGEDDDGSEWEEGEALDEDEQVGDAAEAEGGEGDLELDPSQYEDDEAFARALQDAEGRDVADRLMALVGIGDWRAMEQDGAGDEEEDVEDDGVHTQDAWEDVDPDEYSYEELIALGEVVGTESKGLAADTIASLPSVTYQAKDKQDGNMEQCVICRVEFDEGESLVALPCKHPYHSECINQWLQLNKVCPMCSAEVSTSVNKQA